MLLADELPGDAAGAGHALLVTVELLALRPETIDPWDELATCRHALWPRSGTQ